MTASDRPRPSSLHHPAYRSLPAVQAALRGSLFAAALGCAAPAMAEQAAEAVVAGPDIVARGDITHIYSGANGLRACRGRVANLGTVGAAVSLSVTCDGVLTGSGNWSCTPSGGASCGSVWGNAGEAYLLPGAAVEITAFGSTGSGAWVSNTWVSGRAEGDVDMSNNVSTRCVSVTTVPRPAADLSATVRYPRRANFGGVVNYEVDVENHGPADIPFGTQSNLRVNFSALLREPRSASCTALTAGAQCGSTVYAAHDGAYFPIGLPVGGRVTLRLSGTISTDVGLEEYAFVRTDFSCLPMIDTNASNEDYVETKLTLFHDEFELPSTTITE